jgi:hypothetical protein
MRGGIIAVWTGGLQSLIALGGPVRGRRGVGELPDLRSLFIGNLTLFVACATCWIARSVLGVGIRCLGAPWGLVSRGIPDDAKENNRHGGRQTEARPDRCAIRSVAD